ncbi:hypothetical protein JYG23_07600 [Sedimentibacter sp. zth1]|uniref:hypothetical protein n=1 Tax=Sedimentibacter sp. zth1 TaxID=2816908 RepID=UPI001A90E58C|nr:hypothetical protein [Sedimentibacter sp. zth1]QSX07199.1 hypothetical protein JYG23_07600 [Sedimentibacter sp. zth1]
MKKFEFSLEKILQFKNQNLKNLKNDLSNLQFLLSKKDEEIENLKIKYIKSDNLYIEKTRTLILSYEIQYYKDYMNSLLNLIKKKSEEKQILLKKIELKKLEIIEMNREISTIDKLKEKKVDEYNKALQKSEEIFIEEFVTASSLMSTQNF